MVGLLGWSTLHLRRFPAALVAPLWPRVAGEVMGRDLAEQNLGETVSLPAVPAAILHPGCPLLPHLCQPPPVSLGGGLTAHLSPLSLSFSRPSQLGFGVGAQQPTQCSILFRIRSLRKLV